MGAGRVILIAIWLASLFVQPAFAQKRVALVIGNSNYQNVARLSNPANDAAVMTETLKDAGFDVVNSRRDLKTSEMRRALRDFSDQARDADVAVVYYAGHGIEIEGTNYLIPVDAVLERDIDVYDEAFPLDRVLVTIDPAKQLRLVILDACRDNPFSKTMRRTIGSRSIGRGLAKVEPQGPNTLIAFASKAGSTASDGDNKNSPFTAALVKHIARPGLDLRKAFGFVRDEVMKKTGNKQEPYVYGSLGGDDVALVPIKTVVSVAPAATPNQQSEIRRDYELALQLGTKEVWTAFLAQYPEGLYATLAKGQLSKIASEDARVVATEKSRLAEEERVRLKEEGAKQAEQAKAAARAKVAEDARIAAEKARQVQQEKVAAAERERAASEKAAAEKLALQKQAAENLAVEKAEAVKVAADKTAAAIPAAQKLEQQASLPPDEQASKPAQSRSDLARSVQIELRRVGCLTASVSDEWTAVSRRSLELFNKYASKKIDVKVASLDALEAVRSQPTRVCPLVCDRGFKVDDDRCTKITCQAGYEIGRDNSCEKTAVKKASRESSARRAPAAPRARCFSVGGKAYCE